MKKRNWIVGVTILSIAVVVLGILLALYGNRLDEVKPVIVGKVWQDSHYGGTFGCLDEWDLPLTQCQVVLRYAGCEGFATIEGGQSSPWYVHVSNGKIVDQAQVDENGVYSFNLNWEPEGAFTGDTDQHVTAVLYRVEILTSVPGFYNQVMIGSNQVRVTKDSKVIQGPQILLS